MLIIVKVTVNETKVYEDVFKLNHLNLSMLD